MGRKTYTDKFRANAVVMLEAAGYRGDREKNIPGALARVAKHLDVPVATLSRWYRHVQNPPPIKLVTEKKGDLVALIDSELEGIFGAMPNARPDADYRALGTVAGILIDKKQLLIGEPTNIMGYKPWQADIIEALRDGRISPDDVKIAYPSLAAQFFRDAGVNVRSDD